MTDRKGGKKSGVFNYYLYLMKGGGEMKKKKQKKKEKGKGGVRRKEIFEITLHYPTFIIKE